MCLGSYDNTTRAEDDMSAFTTKLKSQADTLFGNADKTWNQMQTDRKSVV